MSSPSPRDPIAHRRFLRNCACMGGAFGIAMILVGIGMPSSIALSVLVGVALLVTTSPVTAPWTLAAAADRDIPRRSLRTICRACGAPFDSYSWERPLIACPFCAAVFPGSSSDAFFVRITELAAAHGMRVAGALSIAGERRGVAMSITHSASEPARLVIHADVDTTPCDAIRAQIAALAPGARVAPLEGALRVELPGGDPNAFPLATILDALVDAGTPLRAGPYR